MEESKQLARIQQTVSLIASFSDKSFSIVKKSAELMPDGEPNFKGIITFPMIATIRKNISLIEDPNQQKEQKKMLLAILMAFIKSFCNAYNLPDGKNMNDTQIGEAALILLEECDNFRMEDYILMFAMAKRGKLKSGNTGRIFDRIDIATILEIKSNYEDLRREEGYKIQEEHVRKIEGANVEPVKDGINRWPEVLQKFQKMVKDSEKEREQFVLDGIKRNQEERRISYQKFAEKYPLPQNNPENEKDPKNETPDN